MRTSIIIVVVTTAVLEGILIASAQVSSGSPEAAQQNLAKKPTDKLGQNDQQDATTTTNKPAQNDQQNATTSRRQEAPTQEAPKSDR